MDEKERRRKKEREVIEKIMGEITEMMNEHKVGGLDVDKMKVQINHNPPIDIDSFLKKKKGFMLDEIDEEDEENINRAFAQLKAIMAKKHSKSRGECDCCGDIAELHTIFGEYHVCSRCEGNIKILSDRLEIATTLSKKSNRMLEIINTICGFVDVSSPRQYCSFSSADIDKFLHLTFNTFNIETKEDGELALEAALKYLRSGKFDYAFEGYEDEEEEDYEDEDDDEDEEDEE